MNNLNKEELKETVFVTLGRLKSSIKNGDAQRSLDLLDKVGVDVSDMDIKIMHLEREHE